MMSDANFVTKLHQAALVGFDFGEMEDDVPAQLLEKWHAVANQDWHDRITNLVGQSKTKTFA